MQAESETARPPAIVSLASADISLAVRRMVMGGIGNLRTIIVIRIYARCGWRVAFFAADQACRANAKFRFPTIQATGNATNAPASADRAMSAREVTERQGPRHADTRKYRGNKHIENGDQPEHGRSPFPCGNRERLRHMSSAALIHLNSNMIF
jgi:hypothetical protein